jgi:hypothetical protein
VNYVCLSPHFPPNFHRFAVELRRAGAHVLGLADAPAESLPPALREALSEYYRVDDMEDYDQLLRALGHFTHRHGRIHGIDAHSEHWMEAEARLRTDFNIPGLRAADIAGVKRKSRMKETYRAAGIPVARGGVVRSEGDAAALVAELGYPLVAKPDVGVGAAGTCKLRGPDDLARFLSEKPPVDYVFEAFISGELVTFDGLADREGNVVFSASHVFSQGIMETVNEDRDLVYCSEREIPADLEELGRRTVQAFGVRARFFHLEFFRLPDSGLVAVEVNLRPPGGLTTDMFNYANDIDVYRGWAELMVHGRFPYVADRPYHCAHVGRKDGRPYARSHDDVLAALGDRVVHHTPIDSVFRAAIGDYAYLVRSPDRGEVMEAARLIQEVR